MNHNRDHRLTAAVLPSPGGPAAFASPMADELTADTPEPTELTADTPEPTELSDRESRFVDEYCVDFNGTAAAKRAGYSGKSAKYQARDLLKKPYIRAAIDQQIGDLGEDTRTRKEAILRETADMAFAKAKSVSGKAVKLRALELLGKARAIWTDKVEHSGSVTLEEVLRDVDE